MTNMSGKKILIIDFDVETLNSLSQLLKKEGYLTLTALDGFAGEEKHKAERPDLVIMEAMLPKLHGFDLCARITQGEWKTPVIILTGVYKENIYKTEATRTHGAAAYFEKPYDPESLLAVIHRLLGRPKKSPNKDDVLDSAIFEALALKAPAKAPGQERPKVEQKKRTPADVTADVDLMLNEALAELGLMPGKKAPKPHPTPQSQLNKPKIQAPQPSPQQPVPQISKKPSIPDKAHVSKEEDKAVKIEGKESLQPDFGGAFLNRKKAKFPRVLAIIASVLIFSGSAYVLFKPHKNATSLDPSSTANPPISLPGAESVAEQAGALQAGNILEKSEPYLKNRGDDTAIASSRLSNQNSGNEQRSQEEETRPILPVQPAPSLEIQAPDSDAGAGSTNAPQTSGTQAEERAADANPAENPPEEAGGTATAPINKTNRGDVVPLESADVPPQLIKSADPVYPAAALNLRVEGQVLVNCLVSENGDVVRVSILRGIKGNLGFEKAAENAVKRWKFRPAEKDGVAVKVWKPIAIAFKLNR